MAMYGDAVAVSCSGCAFFRRIPDRSGLGKCVRRAPQSYGNDRILGAAWPIVGAEYDWCGEYVIAPEAREVSDG